MLDRVPLGRTMGGLDHEPRADPPAPVRLVARMEEDSAVTQVETRRGAPQQRDLVLAVSAEVLAGRVNAERTRAHVVVRLVDAASVSIESARNRVDRSDLESGYGLHED